MRDMQIAVIALALCTATPAFAGDNELALGRSSRSLRTASANAVTGENLGGVQLTAARQIHLELVTNLQIWGAIGFASTSTEGDVFGMQTEIDALDVTFGGRARYLLHSHVALFARLEGGPTRTALSIQGNGHTVSDQRWGMLGTGAVGIDLMAMARSRFGFGMRFELGYVAHSGPALAPAEGASEDMLVLSGSQASIGHLDLGGRYVAFSLLAQF